MKRKVLLSFFAVALVGIQGCVVVPYRPPVVVTTPSVVYPAPIPPPPPPPGQQPFFPPAPNQPPPPPLHGSLPPSPPPTGRPPETRISSRTPAAEWARDDHYNQRKPRSVCTMTNIEFEEYMREWNRLEETISNPTGYQVLDKLGNQRQRHVMYYLSNSHPVTYCSN